MKYIVDHDLHIHSRISSCSNDPEQTPERILQHAKDDNLNTLCITDHFWDSDVEGASGWYAPQNFEHISAAKPLPQSEGIRFLFGCETELNRFMTVGISKEKYDLFDFIIIPTTHFHMTGYTLSEEQTASPKARAKAWVDRFDKVLEKDLPFHKTGIAHLTCGLMAPTKEEFLASLNEIQTDDMYRLFKKAADVGVGIELNTGCFRTINDVPAEERETKLRPYIIAKECGCKFYFGSDAHHPKNFDGYRDVAENVVNILGLEESDKFII